MTVRRSGATSSTTTHWFLYFLFSCLGLPIFPNWNAHHNQEKKCNKRNKGNVPFNTAAEVRDANAFDCKEPEEAQCLTLVSQSGRSAYILLPKVSIFATF